MGSVRTDLRLGIDSADGVVDQAIRYRIHGTCDRLTPTAPRESVLAKSRKQWIAAPVDQVRTRTTDADFYDLSEGSSQSQGEEESCEQPVSGVRASSARGFASRAHPAARCARPTSSSSSQTRRE